MNVIMIIVSIASGLAGLALVALSIFAQRRAELAEGEVARLAHELNVAQHTIDVLLEEVSYMKETSR